MKHFFTAIKEASNNTGRKKFLVTVLCLVLLCAVVSGLAGCNKKDRQTETVVQVAADPDSLGGKLSADGDGAVLLNEDITASEIIFVNGNKTLSGTGRISAAPGCGEYIIVINEGSSLTVDGVTIDGAGSGINGIYVSPSAGLSFRSGSLENLSGHGVRVLGGAEFLGGEISSVGTNWVMVDENAGAALESCRFTDCGEAGIITGSGSRVILSKGAVLSGSGSNLVYNGGDMEITGSGFGEATGYTIHNDGVLSIKDCEFSGAKVLGYIENNSDAEVSVSNSVMKDSSADFVYNMGSLTMEDCTMDNCLSGAIESKGSSSVLSLTDCEITKVGKTALLLKSGKASVKNLKIGDCGACGINNRGSEFTGENVDIASAGDVAVYNNSVSDADATVGNLTLKTFSIGTASSYCIRTNGGVTQLSAGKVGKGDSYGLYIRDGKVLANNVAFLGTNDTDRNVVQVGLSSKPAGELVMTDCTVTGGSRGVANYGSFTFNSGRIYGNKSGSKSTGAGVYNAGTFEMNGGEITLNMSRSASGGGLSNSKGTATINGGSISYNYAGKYGGGIFNSGTLYFKDGTIAGNTGCLGGGGLHTSGESHFSGGRITENTSGNGGGGVYVGSDGFFCSAGTEISYNSSSNEKSGGGIAVNGGRCTILNGTAICYNSSAASGGGIYNYGTLYMEGGFITGNTAVKNGGGVVNATYTNDDDYTFTGTFKSAGGTINYNHAENYGGGVYSSGLLNLSKITIAGNTSVSNGGGLYVSGTGALNDSHIVLNSSEANGGGIAAGSAAALAMANCNVSFNWMVNNGKGGGLYNLGSMYVDSGTVVTGNCKNVSGADTTVLGGGMYNNGTAILGSEIVIHNNVGKAGAANVCNTSNGSLTLKGVQQMEEVYLLSGSKLTVDSSVTPESRIAVTMASFLPGYTVINAAEEQTIAAAIANKLIVLKDNEAAEFESDKLALIQSTEDKTLGILSYSGGEALPRLKKTDSTYHEAALAELFALAGTEGYTNQIELQSNVLLDEAITAAKSVKLSSTDGNNYYVILTGKSSGITLAGTGNSFTNVSFGSVLTLSGSAITVPKSCALTATGCRFNGCASEENGGAINNAGTVTLNSCSFTGCSSQGEKGGGAVYSTGALTAEGCTLTDNTAAVSGGSMYLASGSTASLSDITATDGDAGKYGDDIYNGVTKCNISGKMVVECFYSATGKVMNLTGALTEGSSIGAKVATSMFIPGTCIISADTDALSHLADATALISLRNDLTGSSGYVLGTDGIIKNGREAELFKDGSHVSYGTLDDILVSAAAGNGDTVEILTDAFISGRVTVSSSLTIKGNDHTLSLTGSGEGFDSAGGVLNVSGLVVQGTASSAPVFKLSGGASLTLSGSSFTNVTGASVISASGSSAVSLSSVTFDGCTVAGGYAVSVEDSSSLTADSCTFTKDSVLSVSSSFNITGSTFGTALNLVDYPAESSQAVITLEEYKAGSKLYSWTMDDGKTAEELAACFTGISFAENEAAAGLKFVLVPEGKYALLRASVEAEIYDGDSRLYEGLLADMLNHASLADGNTVKLVSDSVLDTAVEISKNITIDGNGKTITLIFADAGFTVSGSDVKLNNTVVTANTALAGSAVSVAAGGQLTAAGSSFTGISCAKAAINVASGGSFIASSSTISDNSCSGNGAGIYNAGSVTLTDCILSSNTAAGEYGGALYNYSGSISLSGCKLTANSALNYGGAVYNRGGAELSLSSVEMYGNTSKKTGKDIYSRGTLKAEGSVLIDDLYLYNGGYITLTGSLASGSKLVTEIQTAKFIDGTRVIASEAGVSEASFSEALTYVTLANNSGKKESEITIRLGSDGILYDSAPAAELYNSSSVLQKSGSLADMISQASAGYTVKLLKDTTLDGIVTAPASLTINGDGKTLRLASSTSGISGAAGADIAISNLNVTAGFTPAAAISAQGKLTLTNVTLNNAPVVALSKLTGTGVELVSSPVTLSSEVELTANTDNSTIKLSTALNAGSSVTVKTAQYKEGATVIEGESSAVQAAVNAGMITLANNYKSGTTTPKTNPKLLLGTNGKLYANPAFIPEAKLYSSDGTQELSEGALTDMIDEAASEQIVKLLDSVTTLELDDTLVIVSEKNLVLNLNGKTLKGNGNGSVIKNSGTLTVKNGTITAAAGTNSGEGGGIYNEGTLTTDSLTITGCKGTKGGGIYNKSGATLSTTNTAITGNTATTGDSAGGAGVYAAGTVALGAGTSVTGNTATGSNGGGLYVGGGTTTVTGATISGNTDKSATSRDVYVASGTTTTINGGTYGVVYAYAASGKTCTLTVTGGDFTSVSKSSTAFAEISGGRFKIAPIDGIIKSGYHKNTISVDGYICQVVEDPDLVSVTIGSETKNYKTVDAAVAAALEANSNAVTVTLLSDISTSRIELRTKDTNDTGRNITINLNGHTWTAPATASGFFIINSGTTVTVNGSGTMSGGKYYFYANSGSSVIVNSGSFTGASDGIKNGNGTATIYGGSFNHDPTAYVPASGYTVTSAAGVYTVAEEELTAVAPPEEEKKEQTEKQPKEEPVKEPEIQ